MNYGERHAILISEHKGNILSQSVALKNFIVNNSPYHLKLQINRQSVSLYRLPILYRRNVEHDIGSFDFMYAPERPGNY